MGLSEVVVVIGSWKKPLDTFGSLDNQKPKQSKLLYPMLNLLISACFIVVGCLLSFCHIVN